MAPGGTDAGGYEVLANAFGFGVDIPGCPDASRNIREITIDELTIDEREQTTGLDRVGGGGLASFTIGYEPVGASQIHDWFGQARSGKSIRKSISVTLFGKDRTPARGYRLIDCVPVAFGCVNFDTSSTVQTEKLTCKVGRIEFKT